MAGSSQTYYLDSGVFCSFFSEEEGRVAIVEQLLGDAQAGELSIVTSTFALVEVLKVKNHSSLPRDKEEKIVAFFEYPFLRFIEPSRIVCENARALIWRYSALKPKDAVHLASALEYAKYASLDGLYSWDSDFTKLDGVITSQFPIRNPVVVAPRLPLERSPGVDETLAGPG